MNDPNIIFAAFLNYFANLLPCTIFAWSCHIAFAIGIGLFLFYYDYSLANAFTSPYVMLGTLGSYTGIALGTYLRKKTKKDNKDAK